MLEGILEENKALYPNTDKQNTYSKQTLFRQME